MNRAEKVEKPVTITSRRYTFKRPADPFRSPTYWYWRSIKPAVEYISQHQQAGRTWDPYLQLVEVTYYSDGNREFQVLAECAEGPRWMTPLQAMGLEDYVVGSGYRWDKTGDRGRKA